MKDYAKMIYREFTERCKEELSSFYSEDPGADYLREGGTNIISDPENGLDPANTELIIRK